jgi:hypothetical protein
MMFGMLCLTMLGDGMMRNNPFDFELKIDLVFKPTLDWKIVKEMKR